MNMSPRAALADAAKALQTGNSSLACVFLDAARANKNLQQEDIETLQTLCRQLADNPALIAFAEERAISQVKQAAKVMEVPGKLRPEEWMLLVNNISGAYSTARTLTYIGHHSETRALDDAVAALKAFSHDFRARELRSAVKRARGRFHTPLPFAI